MGEPGRLSPEDRERFREDRDRLVCSRLDCLVIFLNRELRFFLKDRGSVEEEKHTGSRDVMICFVVTHSGPSLAPVRLLRRAILDL